MGILRRNSSRLMSCRLVSSCWIGEKLRHPRKWRRNGRFPWRKGSCEAKMRSVSGSHRRTKRVSFHGMDCYSQPRLLGSLHVSSLQILSSLFFLPSFLCARNAATLSASLSQFRTFVLSRILRIFSIRVFLGSPELYTFPWTRSLCVFLFPIKFSLNTYHDYISWNILLLFLHAADPSEYFSFLRYPSSLSSSCL